MIIHRATRIILTFLCTRDLLKICKKTTGGSVLVWTDVVLCFSSSLPLKRSVILSNQTFFLSPFHEQYNEERNTWSFLWFKIHVQNLKVCLVHKCESLPTPPSSSFLFFLICLQWKGCVAYLYICFKCDRHCCSRSLLHRIYCFKIFIIGKYIISDK